MVRRGRKRRDSPSVIPREILEAVDNKGRVIALLPRGEIHRQRLRHRAVHVFIFSPKGEIYLQKRAAHKDEHPGLWDSSAAGHVSPGEPNIVAARRELQEELNILCNLIEVGTIEACEETGWEFVSFYVGVTNKTPVPDPVEIETGRFFALEEVEKLLTQTPEIFTPAFRLLWEIFKEKGLPLLKAKEFGAKGFE